MKLYLIGSLRNAAIPSIAQALRDEGFDVFDDWYAAGPEADDFWQKYEIDRGHSFEEAIQGLAARHVFDFDFENMIVADAAVLATPAGKSGHLELGYFLGQGKPGHILLHDDPDRFDVMYRFASGIHRDVEGLAKALRGGVDDQFIAERWTVGR